MKELQFVTHPRTVPEWRSETGSELGFQPRVALLCGALSVLFLVYQAWLLPVLTAWVSSAVDEGFVTYAAQRIREGAWPHRDFFYLWTPGTPLLHAGLEAAGISWVGERAASLIASLGSALLILGWARRWRLPFVERALLAALLAVWSFSLWNIPYSSWYAVFLALLAMRVLPRSLAAAGGLFALSFWFKQNIGIPACLGALFWLLRQRDRSAAARVGAVFLSGVILPFAAIGIFGGGFALRQALSQIFIFPFHYVSLMGTAPASETFAAPLSALGLWVLSLYFLRADSVSRSARLVQLGVVAYVVIYAMKSPEHFLQSGFILLSIMAWPLSLALALTEREGRSRFLGFWLPGLGIFFQVFPRLDFQHFLFVFPLSALLLAYALARLHARYTWLPPFWARLPAILLLASGVILQGGVVDLRLNGSRDSLGRISSGSGQRLDEEVTAVWRYLKSEGLKAGDPILVLPNAVAVYGWTGFRNPTPHPQFFPGYVDGFGDKQSAVLPEFRAAGGRFLVVQERSGLESDVPQIWEEIQKNYREVKSFPEHFTVYAPR
ncbi:MAG: hypothetical protein ACXVCS_00250 [Bdellovibrionota bacterium]